MTHRSACLAASGRSTVRGSMARVVLRAVLFGSVVLALWSLARPASAAIAPLCDDRGASAIAPPPLLQAPDDAHNEAIERAHVAPSCTRGDLPLGASIAAPKKGVPKLSP